MSRNLVICCDGTANEFARHATNMLKLYSVLIQDSQRQLTYYHPGLGTMEAAAALTSTAREVTKLLGKAVGYGLENDVRDIYAYLMNFYQEGDRVYLFGFSRGAYTVRAVASLLHMYGLIRRGQEPLIPYAIRMMSALNAQRGSTQDAGAATLFLQAGRFKATFSGADGAPHFVGVWDTVSSVGWVDNPLKLPFTANNPSIRIGRHAVSIDERRAFFRTNLWRPADPPRSAGPVDLMQVWFPGVHSDVGGGYAEDQSGLSKYPLEWMVSEAQKAGLLIDRTMLDRVMGRTGHDYAPADANGMLHESLTWHWWPAEFIPKRRYNPVIRRNEWRMNRLSRRGLPPSPLVHAAAFLRQGYLLPPGAVRVETDPVA